jgi:hypothetical protein
VCFHIDATDSSSSSQCKKKKSIGRTLVVAYVRLGVFIVIAIMACNFCCCWRQTVTRVVILLRYNDLSPIQIGAERGIKMKKVRVWRPEVGTRYRVSATLYGRRSAQPSCTTRTRNHQRTSETKSLYLITSVYDFEPRNP